MCRGERGQELQARQTFYPENKVLEEANECVRPECLANMDVYRVAGDLIENYDFISGFMSSDFKIVFCRSISAANSSSVGR